MGIFNIKKVLIAAIASVLAFSGSVCAEGQGFAEEASPASFSAQFEEEGAYGAIVGAMLDLKDEVSLAEYKIGASELNALWAKVKRENPELFYIESGYSYHLLNDEVTLLEFSYNCPKSEIPSRRALIDGECAVALSYIDDNMTDYEKALVLHNYIVTAYEYSVTSEIRDIYNFVLEKKGVCQAYSLMYMYIARKAGLGCHAADSDEINHVWNIILVDGKWYHTDTTFDDPTYYSADVLGRCRYKYFLKSDFYMANNDHPSWEAPYTAQDTFYDDSFLNGYGTQVIYADGSWYAAQYPTNSAEPMAVREIDINTGEGSVIFSFSLASEPYDWWKYPHSFNIAPYGQYIIFNTHDAVCFLKPGDDAAQKLYTLPGAGEGVYITGLAADGNIIICCVSKERYAQDGTIYRTDISSMLSPYDFEIKSFFAEGGKIKVKYTENSLFDGEYKVYAAGYGADGALLFAADVTKSGETEARDAAFYRAFIWSETKPLCESAGIE